MTDATTELRHITGVEIALGEVAIPHPNLRRVRFIEGLVLQANLWPPIFWLGGAISTWMMIALFAVALGLGVLYHLRFPLRSCLILRPGQLAEEVWCGPALLTTRAVPLQTIREVQVLDPTHVDVSQGSLMLHLTDGSVVRVYPCTDTGDARVVAAWLSEVVSRQETVALAQDPVPEALRDLRRREKARE